MVDCKSCNSMLDEVQDRQKSTGGFWKNCQRCREHHTSKRRIQKGLAPRPSRIEKTPVVHKAPTTLGSQSEIGLRRLPLSASAPRGLSVFEKIRKMQKDNAIRISLESGSAGSAGSITSRTPATNLQTPLSSGLGLSSSSRERFTLAQPRSLSRPPPHSRKERRTLYYKHIPTKSPSPAKTTVELECSVCGDTSGVDSFPHIERCTHEPRVCQDCFANWLTSQVSNTSWDRIVCPSTGCGVLISHEEVKNLATPETFTRYDELSIRSFLNADAQFRYCLRSGCSSGQVHDSGEEGNIFRCNACAFLVCTTHDEAFHAGETCAEYDERKSCERKVEDDASAEMIQGTTKQCPSSSCAVRIEKNEGCDHMTCRRCSHEFCWVCLAPYSGPQGIWRAGNSVHAKTCKHWRSPPGAVRVEPAPMAPVTPPVVPVPSPYLGQTQAQSAINLDDSDDDHEDFQLDLLVRRRLGSLA